jgi:16S rRNA (cytidine1402-2'-O)-methyltransferase
MPGTLYLVATPIGNYEDITFRALNVLKSADVIVVEERNEGMRLLAQYGIETKSVETLTLNEHNEAAASFHIIDKLKHNKNVAVISDAGTPVFSDPGKILVQKAIENDITIVPIPGPSSLLPALVLSGFPIDTFLFYGFLSPKRNRRIAELKQIRSEPRTFVLMDTPYRLVSLLRDIAEVLGDSRRICIAINLTMPDEQILRGTASELYQLAAKENLKGEFVIVVERM